MKKLAIFSTVLAAACGGAVDDFAANAPSLDHLALLIDGTEAADAQSQAVENDHCHPHLFVRTHEVVGRLNRHSHKLLRHVRELVAHHPDLADGASQTWQRSRDGVDRKLTITRSGGTYSFELDFAVHGSNNWVKVAWGSITPGADLATGNATFDYDALHSVIPRERARGKMIFEFSRVHDATKPAPGIKKTMTIKFENFRPEDDGHGLRNGSFVHVVEPGIGGSLAFADDVILFCPDNSAGAPADTMTVSRWYKSGDAIHARSDASASGGQIPAGHKFVGLSCHNGMDSGRHGESGTWLMKLEDSTGATVRGSARQGNGGACDAAFGPVPGLNDNKTDYDFSQPVSFPNQW